MQKKPFIGQKDRVIQIVELSKERTGTGSEKSTETVIANPYAFMNEVSGSEELDGKITHVVKRTYTIRHNATVKQKSNQLIIIDSAKRYQVVHVLEIGRNDHLELEVKLYE